MEALNFEERMDERLNRELASLTEQIDTLKENVRALQKSQKINHSLIQGGGQISKASRIGEYDGD